MSVWVEFVHTDNEEFGLEVIGNCDRWERENDKISGCKWSFH